MVYARLTLWVLLQDSPTPAPLKCLADVGPSGTGSGVHTKKRLISPFTQLSSSLRLPTQSWFLPSSSRPPPQSWSLYTLWPPWFTATDDSLSSFVSLEHFFLEWEVNILRYKTWCVIKCLWFFPLSQLTVQGDVGIQVRSRFPLGSWHVCSLGFRLTVLLLGSLMTLIFCPCVCDLFSFWKLPRSLLHLQSSDISQWCALGYAGLLFKQKNFLQIPGL